MSKSKLTYFFFLIFAACVIAIYVAYFILLFPTLIQYRRSWPVYAILAILFPVAFLVGLLGFCVYYILQWRKAKRRRENEQTELEEKAEDKIYIEELMDAKKPRAVKFRDSHSSEGSSNIMWELESTGFEDIELGGPSPMPKAHV
ncbi:hypothetical protein BU24DRAFT_179568 [Aaosphaeria arxii CBS 175.79]|uniref:Uncharacterized protein n=1 Tax=Aaosphaeria arxii CBS 175.79 TaxID=1450172 RepID=A0A6A5XRH4_9PLEO|nr:uncharacterized protein BU24DRAFT_179568 [Aaosphaeria arxii CBS 175.79]KAF2015496.1 hypothetical protein BU24DRAFT_179568 [Aaosphaeria arxii CBS 175.79]